MADTEKEPTDADESAAEKEKAASDSKDKSTPRGKHSTDSGRAVGLHR